MCNLNGVSFRSASSTQSYALGCRLLDLPLNELKNIPKYEDINYMNRKDVKN